MVAVLLLAATAILTMRMARTPRPTTAVATDAAHFVPVPRSAAIEMAWGIRFTDMILGADGGIVDVRYEVVDPAKSGRIHGGSTANPDPQEAVKNLPVFVDETDGARVLPTSAMMHFEHFHFQTEQLGNTYSIIYGNAGGALHVGDKVTVLMTDGLKLQHVVVAN